MERQEKEDKRKITRESNRKMTREESIQFYKAHAKRLYNISLRIVRDSGEAEEIMQDTILRYCLTLVGCRSQRAGEGGGVARQNLHQDVNRRGQKEKAREAIS